MEDEVHNSGEQSQNDDDIEHAEEDNNLGFVPMDTPNELKRERERTEEEKQLLEKINLLLCRYPGLVPRTSAAIMSRLNELGLTELKNVYTNIVNDVTEIRGTPCADSVILALTYHADMHMGGFTNECLDDIELKRDIES
jgi:hypothetical protein